MSSDGVVLEILEGPDDFQGLVARIVDGLQRRGIEGCFEVLESTAVGELPERIPLLECRMRLVGERYFQRGCALWRADPDALWRVVQDAARWCLETPPVRGASMLVGVASRVAVDPDTNLESSLRDAIEHVDVHTFDFASAGIDRFRVAAVDPFGGRVTLIEASETLGQKGRWRGPVADMRSFFRSHANRLVYGFVKHGSSLNGGARAGRSLAGDWPLRTGVDPRFQLGTPFENEWAPDAFAIQLLGPGYAGRVPHEKHWQATVLGADVVLLEHHELTGWFDTPFVPFGGYGGADLAPQPPPLLEQARADFRDILFMDALAETTD